MVKYIEVIAKYQNPTVVLTFDIIFYPFILPIFTIPSQYKISNKNIDLSGRLIV